MEQVKGCTATELNHIIKNFSEEINQVQRTNTQAHVNIADEYIPKFIAYRTKVIKAYTENLYSIRLNTNQNFERMLNSLNSVLEILLLIPVKQSDRVFLATNYLSLDIELKKLRNISEKLG